MSPFRAALREPIFRVYRHSITARIQKFADATDHQLEQTDTPPRKQRQFLNDQPVMVERLKTRSVLTVSGPGAIQFLNSLTTNELSQLKTEAACLHTLFLNAKGRIIHDALIFRPDEDDTLFVECDIASLQALQTHLIMSRSKANVEIRDVEQDVGVWTVCTPLEIDDTTSAAVEKDNTSFLEDLDLGEDILVARDPRMWPLGVRILAPKDIDIASVIKSAGVKISNSQNGLYKSIRYRLGVAEGMTEIGFGRSLPAEINGYQTNSISLSKSNYTGWSPAGFKKAVDYRMLPLRFHGNTSMISVNSEITDRKGKKRSPIGYLRGVHRIYGLGLMHVPSVLADRTCLVGKIPAECVKPPWLQNDVTAGEEELKKICQ